MEAEDEDPWRAVAPHRLEERWPNDLGGQATRLPHHLQIFVSGCWAFECRGAGQWCITNVSDYFTKPCLIVSAPQGAWGAWGEKVREGTLEGSGRVRGMSSICLALLVEGLGGAFRFALQSSP